MVSYENFQDVLSEITDVRHSEAVNMLLEQYYGAVQSANKWFNKYELLEKSYQVQLNAYKIQNERLLELLDNTKIYIKKEV